jgi:plasmid replication initiation protein
MDEKKKNELAISEVVRGRYVVSQANDLAKAFGNLKTFEHRILDYCISFIKKDDDKESTYVTSYKKILDYLELEDSGTNYARTTRALKRLQKETSLLLPIYEDEDRDKALLGFSLGSLFEKINFMVDGNIEFVFSKQSRPFLFDLKKKFFTFKLEELSKLKSKYTLILIKLWASQRRKNKRKTDDGKVLSYWQLKTTIKGSAEEWQKWFLGEERKMETAVFKRDCLQKAIKEFEEQKGISSVTLTVVKNGRVVDGYEITVESSRGTKNAIEGEVVEPKQAPQETAEALDAPQEAPVSSSVLVDHFCKSFESLTGVKVTKKKKVEIALLIENFDEQERKQILAFAKELFVRHNAEKLNYLITTLKKWIKHEVKTLEQAKAVYEAQNNKTTAKAPASKTNIPHWSDMHPDNANKPKRKPTQEDMRQLIAVQKHMKVFNTPKSIKERENLQKQIDEAQAEASEK